jgi:hypothetical protein
MAPRSAQTHRLPRFGLAPAFSKISARATGGLRRDAAPALFFRPDGRTAERSAPLASAGLVADAGFDEFIRLNWSRLVAGEKLAEFAVPSRLRSLPFSVSRAVKPCCSVRKPGCSRQARRPARLAGSGDRSQLRTAQPSPPALRGFEQPARRQGDRPLVARIDFADPATSASEGQWQAALRTPLSACRAGR